MPKPATFLVILISLGVIAGVWLWSGLPRADALLPGAPGAPAETITAKEQPAAPRPVEATEDLKKQITLLEGQVEYLQGQVKALQDENAGLIQKLGSLGMKGAPMADRPSTPGLKEDEPPDYVTLGTELLSLRKLRAVPMVTVLAPQAEVEKSILAWLKRRFPGDESQRQSKALAALGVIPQPVDILPLRAALMVRQLGGWFDAESETVFLVDPQAAPDKPPPPTDPVLALAFAQVLRDYQNALFPETQTRFTTDAQVAREAVIGGDAALTRFLYSLKNPVPVNANELPPSDPDHPFNEVPLPLFLREMHLFAFTRGFEFAQSLHSAGDFKQLSSAYSRPPASTAEIIDPEIYLAENPPPPVKIEWPDAAVAGARPYWDDTLGRYASFVLLRAHNPDEAAFDAVKNWRADRLLAFAAEGSTRDHIVWQTQWPGAGDARLFFKALRSSLLQRYDQPGADAAAGDGGDGEAAMLEFSAQERFIHLSRNRQGAGVLLIDAATGDFRKAARERFAETAKARPGSN